MNKTVHRISIAKFRCRSNYLPITKSRFDNHTEEDLLCPLCDTSSTGDEQHYMFFCSFFAESRKKYLDEEILQNINNESLKAVFNSSKENLIKVSYFVQEIMQLFKNLYA